MANKMLVMLPRLSKLANRWDAQFIYGRTFQRSLFRLNLVQIQVPLNTNDISESTDAYLKLVSVAVGRQKVLNIIFYNVNTLMKEKE